MFWCISFSWKSLLKLTWICKYVWAALKYHLWKHLIFSKIWYNDDKSNGNSCYCSGNSTSIFLFFLLHHFFSLPLISLPPCSILFYKYFPIYFASSFPLSYMTVPSWLCIRLGAQSHDFFLYCLGQILHSVTLLSLRCDANETKLQHRDVQLWKKQSPYLYNALIYFFVF